MTIELFDRTSKSHLAQLEDLLEECFPQAYGGDLARRQAELCMEEERLAIAALEDGDLIGFVGAIPQYGVTAWELHPLAVTAGWRKKGVGRALVAALEEECAKRG